MIKRKYNPLVAVLPFLLLPMLIWSQERPAKYIVLITIDGLRPEFYLDPSWGMVNLRHMMDEGVAAKGVNPVFPSVTYPDHTTIITGVTPAKHGIYFNAPFRPRGEAGQSYVYYDSIRTETLFDAMKKAGRTTADIIWPVTVHAPIDYNVPDISQPGSKDRRGITADNVSPAGLWKTLQDSAVGQLEALDWNMFDDELGMDENIGRMGAYLIKKHRPGLTAIHFAAADHYQHEYGRDGYGVRAAVAGIDRGIKTLLEAIRRAGIKDSTAIIVTGDHGFENVYRNFQPNVLLKQHGILSDVRNDQWRAQFYQQGGCTFLVLKDPNDQQTLSAVQSLLKGLPDSIMQYFKVIDKRTLEKKGAFPGAALALTGLKGTGFGSKQEGNLMDVLPVVKGIHGFFPDHKEIQTGFVAVGPGLKPGVVLPEMDLVDICPLIIRLTGISFKPMDGKLYPEMFR
ncbi:MULTISPECIES: alkaline phosphatase family protein [Niastella]|uniref:Alkaline phosphatase family protein n=1 Tax=Niastella soli TaxID=2821487 RepID=A0ABS3YLD8_9BACT|nr:ectonucleotide pyrophosphatase/phosphodiesterase [Niastella soli]MBO9198705.1 alkaline phosphatase family protein [Niastella soli]